MIQAASASGSIDQGQAQQLVAQAVAAMGASGKSVLAIIPDRTRTCPLPMIASLLHKAMAGKARKLDFLVALGTHAPLGQADLEALLGASAGGLEAALPGSSVFNHVWDDPSQLAKVGTLSSEQVSRLSGGLFSMSVDVTVNRRIFDYDIVLIVGPVFPHEVMGFSGGSKYFFPGVSGPQLLNFFHWLGAVITIPAIIGVKHTPVRAVVEEAAGMINTPQFALCMVVRGQELAGLYFGSPQQAWSAAADLSARLHVITVPAPFQSILSCSPAMYEDLWTGGKCMYKLESVVADGGELIIYAPHITQLSHTHGRLLEQIGYHTRDYFLANWERFKHLPWGVLAHSTHVKGVGACRDGQERPRINVVLATGIDEQTCRRINLGYRDWRTIDAAQWQNRPDRLHVPKAGEMLYRLA